MSMIATQIKFPPEELSCRMQAVLFSMIGSECSFVEGNKTHEGTIIHGEYKGISEDRGQFEMVVKGKSGRTKTIDYWKNFVALK